jgi:TonB-linked SusC/RagA family outer membrane protein
MKKNYLYKWKLIILFLGVNLSSLLAQETTGSISGKIVDAKGEPLIGVIVLDEETKQGAPTDLEGNFKIANLKEGEHSFLIRLAGYAPVKKKVTIKAGESATLGSFGMEETSKQLNEVLVVGYGTSIKREVTGSISKVGAKDLENVPVQSFDAALQGRAAGLQVVQSSGIAGAAVRVRIRGQSSISGSGEPLYVIDGVPVNNGDFGSKEGGVQSQSLNPLASMNPNDIESVEVLKDAAAGAIYGARAANGVVLITTKRGKSGKTDFNFSITNGVTSPTRLVEYLNADDYQKLYLEAYRNDSAMGKKGFPNSFAGNTIPNSKAAFLNHKFADGTPFGNTNWFDEVLQTGKVQDVNLSARGGSEKITYYMAGGFNDNQSMLKGNEFKRISGRANVDVNATDKLTLGTQLSPSYTSNDQVANSYTGGIGAAQSSALPIYPVYNADGTYFGQQLAKRGSFFDTFQSRNPVAQRENKANTTTFRSLTNLYLNYKIIPNLVLRIEGGLDYMDQFESWYYSPVNRYYNNKGFGAVSERRSIAYNMSNNNTLTFTQTFKEKHKVIILAGASVTAVNQKDIGFTTRDEAGFGDPFFTSSTNNLQFHPDAIDANKAAPLNGSKVNGFNSADFYRFGSYFSRVNYIYDKKYIFQVSLRSDGSSRFGANKRFGYFPAVSASWIISDEKFMQSISWLSVLKLRASYGLTGNSEIGNFAWLGTYAVNGRVSRPCSKQTSQSEFVLGILKTIRSRNGFRSVKRSDYWNHWVLL